jgi:hypothetical protein
MIRVKSLLLKQRQVFPFSNAAVVAGITLPKVQAKAPKKLKPPEQA